MSLAQPGTGLKSMCLGEPEGHSGGEASRQSLPGDSAFLPGDPDVLKAARTMDVPR